MQVLKEEEELARELIRSLPEAIRRKAIISEKAPRDIVTGTGRTAQIGTPEGVSAGEMPTAVEGLLERLVGVYTGRFRPELADRNSEQFSEAGQSSVYFAWAGSTEVGNPHYYKIQGPSFLIEYDNTQNGANHIHTVYRDLRNDFGKDLLKEHYEHSH